MVFKRRDRRGLLRALVDGIYPRGGWTRAFHYIRHRLRRLPDSPERIARGIAAGVFTTFTPFYGLHFVVAGTLATICRGNILASLMATFFGNPLTYVPIAVASLQTGHWLLGAERGGESLHRMQLGRRFLDAWMDLKRNFVAIFTSDEADWAGIAKFYDEIFLPYLVGGILPGLACGLISYYLSVRLIRVYQKRRTDAIRSKLQRLRKTAAATAQHRRANGPGSDPEGGATHNKGYEP